MKDLVVLSYKFLLEAATFKTWNISLMYKGQVFFIWFCLVYYRSWYCRLRTGGRVFLLNRQNLLGLTKVICQQSLKKSKFTLLINLIMKSKELKVLYNGQAVFALTRFHFQHFLQCVTFVIFYHTFIILLSYFYNTYIILLFYPLKADTTTLSHSSKLFHW